ncbi:MAG: hypothetical protein ACFFDW_10660 [Candidatus Thorarchaeota archaeon]
MRKLTIILILGILSSMCLQGFLVRGEEMDFQKIELTPTKVSWGLKSVNNETSQFNINLNVTVFNPNSYSYGITYPTTILQMIGTSGQMDLEDNTSAYLASVCFTFELALDHRDIIPGESYNLSASVLTINKGNLTDLLDGVYTFSSWLYNQNQTQFTSNKLILTIEDGIPTTEISNIFTPTIALPKVIPIITMLFCTIIIFRKKESN